MRVYRAATTNPSLPLQGLHKVDEPWRNHGLPWPLSSQPCTPYADREEKQVVSSKPIDDRLLKNYLKIKKYIYKKLGIIIKGKRVILLP